MNFRPLRDRVFVKFSTEEEKTAGGLFIPDTAKEKPQKGTVVAVGPGKVTEEGKRQPLDVKAGDTVLFDKYSGSKIRMNDEEYLIIREEDILGIVE
jgi:chaperonin GroES